MPFVLVSETSALMHNRGFTLTTFRGRTETATTKDSLGTPERGSSSIRTASCKCTLIVRTNWKWHAKLIICLWIWDKEEGILTSGDLRSTTESDTTPVTAEATISKHLSRSNKTTAFEASLEVFSSVSTPLLLYPTANYRIT